MINSGIKQPLRFYDSVDKQNWRRCWVHDSGFQDENIVINPRNSVIPFQIRRRRSSNPVTVFDLWVWDNSTEQFIYDMDLFTVCNVDTINVIQMQQADNLVWNPSNSFTADIPCGIYYIVVSDGVSTWYSELIKVFDFNATEQINISILPPDAHIEQSSSIAYTKQNGDHVTILISSKPH